LRNCFIFNKRTEGDEIYHC